MVAFTGEHSGPGVVTPPVPLSVIVIVAPARETDTLSSSASPPTTTVLCSSPGDMKTFDAASD